jgi:hypothetical protein
MKSKEQGKKNYVIRINGKVSDLLTINQAIRLELYHTNNDTSYQARKGIEIININELLKGA